MVRSYRNSWRYTCIDNHVHELKSKCTFYRNSSLLNYCHQTWNSLGKEDLQPFRHVVYYLRFPLQWMLRFWSSGLRRNVGSYVRSSISDEVSAASTRKMETAYTYEILVSTYKTSRCYILEDRNLMSKSYLILKLFPGSWSLDYGKNSFSIQATLTVGSTGACNDIFYNKHRVHAMKYNKWLY
jgi:hypothetical protein